MGQPFAGLLSIGPDPHDPAFDARGHDQHVNPLGNMYIRDLRVVRLLVSRVATAALGLHPGWSGRSSFIPTYCTHCTPTALRAECCTRSRGPTPLCRGFEAIACVGSASLSGSAKQRHRSTSSCAEAMIDQCCKGMHYKAACPVVIEDLLQVSCWPNVCSISAGKSLDFRGLYSCQGLMLYHNYAQLRATAEQRRSEHDLVAWFELLVFARQAAVQRPLHSVAHASACLFDVRCFCQAALMRLAGHE